MTEARRLLSEARQLAVALNQLADRGGRPPRLTEVTDDALRTSPAAEELAVLIPRLRSFVQSLESFH